ncbi:MAG: DMT family transporter [Candidatus Yanofskybacteria bacterium]|nr:DMT family transporter [Candidatus Yanofskybacteria bacterium]
MSGKTKIIVATILFSLGPLFVKTLPLDGITVLWSVSFVAIATLLIRMLVQKRLGEFWALKKTSFLTLVFLGILTTVNNSLFNLSIKATTIANAVLTHYLAPVFLLFLGLYFFKEHIEKRSIVALLISLAGLALILSPQELTFDNTHFIGLLLGTASAVFFASEIVAKKKLSLHYKADIITIWFFMVTILLLLPFVSVASLWQMNTADWSMLILYGVIIIATGISLFISGTKDTKAQHIGILSYLEPLGAILWGIVLLSEELTIFTALGGALILFGGYLILKDNKKVLPST